MSQKSVVYFLIT